MNDSTLAIMDAINAALAKVDPIDLDHIEIEARLGVFVQGHGQGHVQSRLVLPCIASETVLYSNRRSPGYVYRNFIPHVTPVDFQYLMDELTKAVAQAPRHVKYRDDLYKNNHRVRCIQYHNVKTRKYTLVTVDVVSPRSRYDFRVQVSVEVPFDDLPPDTDRTMIRRTDRYIFRHCNLEYHCSRSMEEGRDRGRGPGPTYSVEIEALAPKDTFYKHHKFLMSGNNTPSRLFELVNGLCSHVREILQLFPSSSSVKGAPFYYKDHSSDGARARISAASDVETVYSGKSVVSRSAGEAVVKKSSRS